MVRFFSYSLWLSLLICSPLLCSAQQQLKLTNLKTGKELFLKEGTRVSYTLHSTPGKTVGKLTDIQENHIAIGGQEISLADVKSIGKRSRGTGLVTALLGGIGGAMIGQYLFATEPDPCPSCRTVIEEDHTGPWDEVLFIGGGIALGALAVHTAIDNSPRKVGEGDWKLEVVD